MIKTLELGNVMLTTRDESLATDFVSYHGHGAVARKPARAETLHLGGTGEQPPQMQLSQSELCSKSQS